MDEQITKKLIKPIVVHKYMVNGTNESDYILKEDNERNERRLIELQTNLIENDYKIESLEKEMLESNDLLDIKELELLQMKQTIESKNSVEANIDVNAYTSAEISELEFKNNELQAIVNRLSVEIRTNLAKYEHEKNILLTYVSDLDEVKHSVKQMRNILSDEKIKYNNLNEKLTKQIQINNALKSELESIKLEKNEMKALLESHKNSAKHEENHFNVDIIQEKDKKIRCLESNVNLLMKKYKEALKLKKKNDHKIESLPPIINKNFASTQTDECNCGVEEIIQLKESIKMKDVLLENNEQKLLNLELEKERLASVSNSYLQNINELKLLVTSNSKQVSELTQNLDEVETKCSKQVTELENELKKERALVKDLRHTIFIEKRENSNHKKDMIDLKNTLKTSNLVADNNKQLVVNMESEMNKQKDLEQSMCNEIKILKSELTQLKEDNSNCKSKLNELLEQTEQIKSLKQNLLERDENIMALKSENESIKNVFDAKIMRFKQQISNYKNDIELLSCDLNDARKQKLSLQSYLNELPIEVKFSHEEIKRLRDRLKCYELIIANETIFNDEVLSNTFMKLPNRISIKELFF